MTKLALSCEQLYLQKVVPKKLIFFSLAVFPTAKYAPFRLILAIFDINYSAMCICQKQ